MISELKTFGDNFTHFRTCVVMTVEFLSFSCKIQPRRIIGITELLVAKRTKLRQNLGLKKTKII